MGSSQKEIFVNSGSEKSRVRCSWIQPLNVFRNLPLSLGPMSLHPDSLFPSSSKMAPGFSPSAQRRMSTSWMIFPAEVLRLPLTGPSVVHVPLWTHWWDQGAVVLRLGRQGPHVHPGTWCRDGFTQIKDWKWGRDGSPEKISPVGAVTKRREYG